MSEARYPWAVIRERLRSRDGIFDFAIGAGGLKPVEPLRELMQEHALLALESGSATEVAELVEAARELMQRLYGIEIGAEGIVPVPGGRAALAAIAGSVLSPGSGVLVTEPGYPVFRRFASLHGAEVLVAPLDPQRSFLPRLDALDRSRLDDLHLAALNYPNNPTGGMLDRELVAELQEHLPSDAVLFNDATYGPLTHDSPPRSLIDPELFDESGPPLLELHSLSKLLALGPTTVAFLAGSTQLVRKIRELGEYSWSPPSALQLKLATRSLRDPELLEPGRRDLSARVERLRSGLTRLGFRPYPTPSGMYVLCPAPSRIAGTPVEDAVEAADLLFETCRLAVVPWDVPPHGYLRFSALYRPDDLEALEALEEGLAS